jgi:hypothetical protein
MARTGRMHDQVRPGLSDLASGPEPSSARAAHVQAPRPFFHLFWKASYKGRQYRPQGFQSRIPKRLARRSQSGEASSDCCETEDDRDEFLNVQASVHIEIAIIDEVADQGVTDHVSNATSLTHCMHQERMK